MLPQIGDILVQGERGAQVLVTPEMVDHLSQSLQSVRTVTVKVRQIPLDELAVRPANRKKVTKPEPVEVFVCVESEDRCSAVVYAILVLILYEAVAPPSGDIFTDKKRN